MTEGWQTKQLGDVCEIKGGGTPSTAVEQYWGGDIPWVSPKDIRFPVIRDSVDHITAEAISASSTSMIEAGSILLVVRSGILSRTVPVAVAGRELTINQDLKALCPKATVDSWFLYYLLQAKMSVLLGLVTRGATVHRLITDQIRSIRFLLPPLPEQRRIVAVLDEAFETIAIAKANAAKNLQLARELFDLQLAKARRSGGDGWIEAKIGDVCTLKSGTTVPIRIERPSGDVPYVKVAEMTLPANQNGVRTSVRFLARSDVKPGWLIPAGAVIFPKRGGAILTNKKRLALVDMCADLNIMAVIPSERLIPQFLYLYFRGVDMRKIGSGSSIPQINNYDITPLRISFPASKLRQAEIAESLRVSDSECQRLVAIYEAKVTALDELKKSVLHQAFSGAL